MGDGEHRVVPVGQAPQGLQHRLLVAGVEAGGRLVEDEDVGLADHLHGHVGPLTLPARQRSDPHAGLPSETDLTEEGADPALAVRCGYTPG